MQSQNDGVIAQLVEQRTENPCVPGSIPGDTTQKALQKCRAFLFVYSLYYSLHYATYGNIPKAEKEFEIYRKREMNMLESDFDRDIKKLKEK